MLKSTITIYKYPWSPVRFLSDRENWFQERESIFSFNCLLEGEEAAEFAFHVTNCPYDMLEEEFKSIVKNFHGPSASVGDIVKVDRYMRQPGDNHVPEYYLCKSVGWEKYDDCVIELNKYLL